MHWVSAVSIVIEPLQGEAVQVDKITRDMKLGHLALAVCSRSL